MTNLKIQNVTEKNLFLFATNVTSPDSKKCNKLANALAGNSDTVIGDELLLTQIPQNDEPKKVTVKNPDGSVLVIEYNEQGKKIHETYTCKNYKGEDYVKVRDFDSKERIIKTTVQQGGRVTAETIYEYDLNGCSTGLCTCYFEDGIKGYAKILYDDKDHAIESYFCDESGNEIDPIESPLFWHE